MLKYGGIMGNSFKKYCRDHNIKVPLTVDMLNYYTSLGFKCFVVAKNYGCKPILHLNDNSRKYDRLVTLKELRLIMGVEVKHYWLPWSTYESFLI